MKLIKSFLYIALVVTTLAATAFGQATGSISGRVADVLGAVIPTATVTVTDAAGKVKTAVVNGRGEFTVEGLAAGKYTVRVAAAKFAVYENADVQVSAGEKADLDVTLIVQATQETVTVDTANGVSIDPDNNASATVLKGKDLDALPDDPDELEAALQALAGPSAGPNGGQFYIDGFTGGRMPPKDSIREIRINQNPFSAEYERLGFGRVEILTKPGSDKWRGQGFFNFNDARFNSRNPFAINRAPSQTRFFGGNVSGPITKGKSSFFLDVSDRDIKNATAVNALIVDPSFNIVPFQQEFSVPTKRFSVSPRLDYQINKNNTLVARYSFTKSSAENQGISEFSLPTRAYTTSSTSHNLQLTETMILNAKTVNETRFQFERQNSQQNGDNSVPTISVASAFTGGGAQIGFGFTKSNRWELQNYTTTSIGTKSVHAIKFGVRLRNISIDDRSESNFGGTYSFLNIAQYQSKLIDDANTGNGTDPSFIPTQFRLTSGNPLASISQFDIGLFATDDWRVRRDLTLSFGIRYENQTNISDHSDFAPRFAFAWSPGGGGAKQPKTVFRGGIGIFYDRFSENLSLQAIRFNGINQVEYDLSANDPDPVRRAAAVALLSQAVFSVNGVTNTPTAAQIAAVLPGSITTRTIAGDLRAPYTIQTALGIERQLPGRTTVSVFYIGSRNLHLLRTRDINAPVAPLFNVRPDPTRNGPVYEVESSGRLNQQQVIVNFNSRLNPKFSIFGNYRLGFAKSDTDGAGSLPAYSYDLTGEYGRSSLDVRHNLFVGGSFTVPWGVRLSPFIIASSGRPFNIITGQDLNNDLNFTERPTFGALAAACAARGLNNSFCDVSGQDPNAVIPRNFGRGPSYFGINLNIAKVFGFGGGSKAAVADAGDSGAAGAQGGGRRGGGGGRGGGMGGFGGGRGGGSGGFGGGTDKPYNLSVGLQITNLLNRNNQGPPIGNILSSRFGESTSTAGGFGFFGGGGTSSGNRRVELQLRFNW
jgi:Carboxypeptidase regulatory-like domain